MARSISPELHEEFSEKLEQLLDEHDEISEKRSRISKALGGELKIIARGIAHVRRVLKGLDGPQEEIPGTEVGERRRDPGLEQILKAAERVRDASAAAGKAEEKAKAARRAALEDDADQVLRRGGSADLVKRELAGPAAARLPRKR